MIRSHQLPLAILFLTLAGCAAQGTYPITGEACAPEDPVKTVDVAGCVPSGSGGV